MGELRRQGELKQVKNKKTVCKYIRYNKLNKEQQVLLKLLLKNETQDNISKIIHFSLSSVNNQSRKIYKMFGCKGKRDLISLFESENKKRRCSKNNTNLKAA